MQEYDNEPEGDNDDDDPNDDAESFEEQGEVCVTLLAQLHACLLAVVWVHELK